MKLQNKKTGEIGDLIFDKGSLVVRTSTAWEHYSSLAELNAEWEDYEEPEEYYFIADFGGICARDKGKIVEDEEDRKAIGNYFETKEEAEKAVEKLKAWKRLRDKGFRFERWFGRWLVGGEYNDETRADLDLLFGGEE
jgi:hypothetical protein